MTECLNCGEELRGQFCAACGQRSVPADPTVTELAGDAWQELSGYDGRVSASFRGLLHPGQLTREYLQGRRARYLPPVRLYLTASVIYFLVAAAAPAVVGQSGEMVSGPGGLKISVTETGRDKPAILTDEDRAEIVKQLDNAAWFVRPMLKKIVEDPEGFRARIFTIMPRVFFALLPVFAVLVALFYRGRRFPVALIFAVHLHAFAFLVLTLPEIAKFSQSPILAGSVAAMGGIAIAAYALKSFRVVFGDSWPRTVAKAAGIGLAYALISVPAFLLIVIWASLV